MKIISCIFNEAPSSFLSELQQYCNILMAASGDDDIASLFILKQLLIEKATQLSIIYQCNTINFLEFEIHSYVTFTVFNLIYDDDTAIIAITARNPGYVEAFTEYDKTHPLAAQRRV